MKLFNVKSIVFDKEKGLPIFVLDDNTFWFPIKKLDNSLIQWKEEKEKEEKEK